MLCYTVLGYATPTPTRGEEPLYLAGEAEQGARVGCENRTCDLNPGLLAQSRLTGSTNIMQKRHQTADSVSMVDREDGRS
jgi:hypothetical protein